jgi:hypothetical protein
LALPAGADPINERAGFKTMLELHARGHVNGAGNPYSATAVKNMLRR